MATKNSGLTANSRFVYQGKDFFPGEEVSIANVDEALELLKAGFIVGVVPQNEQKKKVTDTPAVTASEKTTKTTQKRGAKK